MIKNLTLILMAFTLTASSAWCCGVRSVSLPQVQQQIQQNVTPVNNPPVSQPAPEPIPEPETFAEFLKDVAGDFERPDRENSENLGQGGLENLPVEVAQLIDDLENALTIPTFAGDEDADRIARNDKQIAIAQELVQPLQDKLVDFLEDANAEISEFSSSDNQALLSKAPESVIESFFDAAGNLHQEFFRDIVNAVRNELGNNLDPNTFTVNEQTGELETSLEDAQIDGSNSSVPSADQILGTLAFTTTDFLKDFEFVRESTLDQIKNQESVSNQTSQVNSNIDFDGALDSGFATPTRQAIRFDVLNPVLLPGGSRTFDRGTSSIVSLIQDLQSRFPGTALAEDLAFFLAVFPPATEQAVQSGLEPNENTFVNNDTSLNNIKNTTFNEGDPFEQFDPNQDGNTFTTSAFTVGVGGQLVGIDPNGEQPIERSSQVTRVLSDVSGITSGQIADGAQAGFNSRTFGGSSGDFPSVQITVGDVTYEVYDHVFTSPIVLDLDNDGKLEASNGVWLPHTYKNGQIVEFDINGDGFVDLTEWVGKNDGILIQYNPNKPVDGTQLFGDADGFINGYEKLRTLDADENNVLDGEELSTLSVWQDKNTNAKVDAGEITSLEELKITELSVEHEAYVSNFVMDGKSVKMWDWFPSTFRVKKRK